MADNGTQIASVVVGYLKGMINHGSVSTWRSLLTSAEMVEYHCGETFGGVTPCNAGRRQPPPPLSRVQPGGHDTAFLGC